jgi:hypothetical protein
MYLEMCIVALAGPPPADLPVVHGPESKLHGPDQQHKQRKVLRRRGGCENGREGGNGRLRGGIELVFLDFGLGRRERRERILVLLGVVPHLLLHRPLRNTAGEVNINRIEPSPREWTGEERGVGERGAYRRAEGGGGERVEEPLGQRRAEGVVPPASKSEGDRD